MTNALEINPPGNEAETITSEIWDTASSAEIMVQMLRESKRQIAQFEPHFYLFAAWCARRVGNLLSDQRSHSAIRTAELFATGGATRTQMQLARYQAENVVTALDKTYKEWRIQLISAIFQLSC